MASKILQAEFFEAVSRPTRIQILKTLRGNALGFAELNHKLGISSSGNLSHHLNKLAVLLKCTFACQMHKMLLDLSDLLMSNRRAEKH